MSPERHVCIFSLLPILLAAVVAGSPESSTGEFRCSSEVSEYPEHVANFSGRTGYLHVAAAATAQRASVTLSAWVYMTATQSADATLLHNGLTFSNGFGLVVRSAPLNKLAVFYPPSTVVTSSYSVPVSTWVYLSAVSTSDVHWDLFENGRQVDSIIMPKAASAPSAKFSVCGNGKSAFNNFDGMVGHVVVWNAPRSGLELVQDSRRGGVSALAPNLALFLPFYEGDGVTVASANNDMLLTAVGSFRWKAWPEELPSGTVKFDSIAADCVTTGSLHARDDVWLGNASVAGRLERIDASLSSMNATLSNVSIAAATPAEERLAALEAQIAALFSGSVCVAAPSADIRASKAILRDGDNVVLSCVEGMLGNATVRTCRSGQLDGADPRCTPLGCDVEAPLNGYVSNVNGYLSKPTLILSGTTAIYSCVTGYTLVGNRTLTCLNVTLSGPAPECVPQNCTAPSAPLYGAVSPSAGSVLLHGEFAFFNCSPGYPLVGSTTRQCLAGSMTNSTPSCGVPCLSPAAPINGTVWPNTNDTVLHGEYVNFTCNAGFTLSGSSSRRCANGVIVGSAPTCRADCTGSIANGTIVGQPCGAGCRASFTCDASFYLFGSASSVCTNGTWSPPLPICNLPRSCQDVFSRFPNSTAGRYLLQWGDRPVSVFCSASGAPYATCSDLWANHQTELSGSESTYVGLFYLGIASSTVPVAAACKFPSGDAEEVRSCEAFKGMFNSDQLVSGPALLKYFAGVRAVPVMCFFNSSSGGGMMSTCAQAKSLLPGLIGTSLAYLDLFGTQSPVACGCNWAATETLVNPAATCTSFRSSYPAVASGPTYAYGSMAIAYCDHDCIGSALLSSCSALKSAFDVPPGRYWLQWVNSTNSSFATAAVHCDERGYPYASCDEIRRFHVVANTTSFFYIANPIETQPYPAATVCAMGSAQADVPASSLPTSCWGYRPFNSSGVSIGPTLQNVDGLATVVFCSFLTNATFASCPALFATFPALPNGPYWLTWGTNVVPATVYCSASAQLYDSCEALKQHELVPDVSSALYYLGFPGVPYPVASVCNMTGTRGDYSSLLPSSCNLLHSAFPNVASGPARVSFAPDEVSLEYCDMSTSGVLYTNCATRQAAFPVSTPGRFWVQWSATALAQVYCNASGGLYPTCAALQSQWPDAASGLQYLSVSAPGAVSIFPTSVGCDMAASDLSRLPADCSEFASRFQGDGVHRRLLSGPAYLRPDGFGSRVVMCNFLITPARPLATCQGMNDALIAAAFFPSGLGTASEVGALVYGGDHVYVAGMLCRFGPAGFGAVSAQGVVGCSNTYFGSNLVTGPVAFTAGYYSSLLRYYQYCMASQSLFATCKDVYESFPRAPSGLEYVLSWNGVVYTTSCDMETDGLSSNAGWTYIGSGPRNNITGLGSAWTVPVAMIRSKSQASAELLVQFGNVSTNGLSAKPLTGAVANAWKFSMPPQFVEHPFSPDVGACNTLVLPRATNLLNATVVTNAVLRYGFGSYGNGSAVGQYFCDMPSCDPLTSSVTRPAKTSGVFCLKPPGTVLNQQGGLSTFPMVASYWSSSSFPGPYCTISGNPLPTLCGTVNALTFWIR